MAPDTIEREYYENSDLWAPEKYGGIETLRAGYVASQLPPDVISILDAGCGNGVFANRLKQTHQIIGIDRSWAALQYVEIPRSQVDILKLPFPDATFDAVISMEVLEHLPYYAFQTVLRELSRVTKQYVLITVPYCENRVVNQVTCPACKCVFHANYHMRRFDRRDLETLFETDQYESLSLMHVEGLAQRHNYLFRHQINAVFRPKQPLPHYTICPQCGYRSKNDKTNCQPPKYNSGQNNLLVNLLKKLWPRTLTYRWWMALYSKQ